MEIVNLNVFARNLKATTCRIEIKSRTHERADYGKGEKYNVIHLTKMREEENAEITWKPR